LPVPKVTLQLARSAKQRAAEMLGDLPGLVGIGLTKTVRGGYALKVNLETEPPSRRRVPKTIGGVPVAVEVVGRVRAR
jgi:hypothetical protein